MVYNGLGKIPLYHSKKHVGSNVNIQIQITAYLWHLMKNEWDDKLFLVAHCTKTSDTWDYQHYTSKPLSKPIKPCLKINAIPSPDA